MSHLVDRLGGAALILMAGGCILLGGCSTTSGSAAYLTALQQTAMNGSLGQLRPSDATGQCPNCNPDEMAFAQEIVASENGMDGTCNRLPSAESSYRQVRTLIDGGSVPVATGYKDYVDSRMCAIAGSYANCSDPARRRLSPADQSGPAGALTSAIDECRTASPATADDITNHAIAAEAESISESVQRADYDKATQEISVYAALPRANQERVAQWHATIAQDQRGQEIALHKASLRARQMVCAPSVKFVDYDSKGNPSEIVVAGMNARHKNHPSSLREDGGVTDPAAATAPKEKLRDLVIELASEENLSVNDSQRVLRSAYDRALSDDSYCAR